ncbi:MAG: hypothetical protein V5A68_06165 [Candidatus Thermoplasmatota archaeon]
MVSKLSDETIEKIRKLVRDGKSKCSVARETGLSVGAVCKYTKDLPNHSEKVSCIRGREVGVLKKSYVRDMLCLERVEKFYLDYGKNSL